MFAPLPESTAPPVTVLIDGSPRAVPANCSAAAAVLMHGDGATRTTVVSGEGRAPYCMMGVCFECLLEIDGEPNQQGCLVTVRDGMRIARQHGRRAIDR